MSRSEDQRKTLCVRSFNITFRSERIESIIYCTMSPTHEDEETIGFLRDEL